MIHIRLIAQTNNAIERIDPPNWWTGMQQKELQLLIKATDIGECTNITIKEEGIKLLSFEKSENKDYLFLNLNINDDAKAQWYTFTLKGKNKELSMNYELKPRKKSLTDYKSLNNSDFIYLIMPDRFANGDVRNDVNINANERTVNRDSILYRHGGDLAGVINHLDYIQQLGATAIWLNPVQENNQPKESYHGYAITDHYKIDSRLGTIEDYKNLVEKAQSKSMKVVMDMVYNHTGNEHYLFKEKPSKDWFHEFTNFTRTNYRATTLMDPYVAEYDKNLMQNAWFDRHMPDLNQKNKLVSKYLINNSIWWIETTGINGFRVDTWAYPDQEFMKTCTRAILDEYPDFTIFGEVWEHGPAIQAKFADNIFEGANKGQMPGIIDFELYYAINEALTKPFGWTEGASRIYYTLAQDFLYQNPNKNVIFLDNHDLSRYSSMVDGNIEKFKSGIAFLLTMRGIPSLFYGTEILMKAWSNPDAKVRIDFPGGWPNDSINKFIASGRTNKENEAFEYISKLANYRKNCKAITEGKLIQFVPENGIYVYFRYSENQKVMIIMNTNNNPAEVETTRFKEMLHTSDSAINVITKEKISLLNALKLKPNETLILELVEQK